MRREIPEPWLSAMLSAGFTDPRYDGVPSMTRLAKRIGVHASTISSMIYGERETDQATVDKVAEALRVDPLKVAEWVGRVRFEPTPWEPPAVASLMDSEQRRLVEGIIRQFARVNQAPGSGVNDEPGAIEEPHLLAARRGTSQGKTHRQRQDDDATRPDDDGYPYGS